MTQRLRHGEPLCRKGVAKLPASQCGHLSAEGRRERGSARQPLQEVERPKTKEPRLLTADEARGLNPDLSGLEVVAQADTEAVLVVGEMAACNELELRSHIVKNGCAGSMVVFTFRNREVIGQLDLRLRAQTNTQARGGVESPVFVIRAGTIHIGVDPTRACCGHPVDARHERDVNPDAKVDQVTIHLAAKILPPLCEEENGIHGREADVRVIAVGVPQAIDAQVSPPGFEVAV